MFHFIIKKKNIYNQATITSQQHTITTLFGWTVDDFDLQYLNIIDSSGEKEKKEKKMKRK